MSSMYKVIYPNPRIRRIQSLNHLQAPTQGVMRIRKSLYDYKGSALQNIAAATQSLNS